MIWVEPLRGKGKLEVRRAVGSHLTKWGVSLHLSLEPAFLYKIEKGFPKGDDAFDAVVGLFGMIEVAKGILNMRLRSLSWTRQTNPESVVPVLSMDVVSPN